MRNWKLMLICSWAGMHMCQAQLFASEGDSLLQLGRYRDAVNSYAKKPTLTNQIKIAQVYEKMLYPKQAIKQYEFVLSKDPKNPFAQLALGKLYLSNRNHALAIATFQKLVQQDSTVANYHYYLGRAIAPKNECIQHYKKAVAIDSTHIRALYRLSKAYLDTKKWHLVDLTTAKGLSTKPYDKNLLLVRGEAFYQRGLHGDAIAIFERLMSVSRLGDRTKYKLANSYYEEWEFEKGIALMQEMLDASLEADYKAWYMLGLIYIKQKNWTKAAFALKRSLEEKTQTFGKEYDALARVYAGQQQYKKAVSYYEKAFREENNPMYMFYACNLTRKHIGDNAHKIAYLTKFRDYLETRKDQPKYFKKLIERQLKDLKEKAFFGED
ncbi:MAG: tetratricopeptide repeat protein [Flavobacteriaceae bacterium]|nr:tetratricopeptide repeat protein [Flavobacteriaceae bacterium]